MTTFSTLSDLVNITPVKTPMHLYLHHRIFRCLGLAGPLVLFSLNPSAGPTRQLHSVFLPPRETAAPAPPPVRRRRARALHCKPPPLLLLCAASRARSHNRAPLLLRRCSAATLAPPYSAPTPPASRRPRAAVILVQRRLHRCSSCSTPSHCTSLQAKFEVPSTLCPSARQVFEELPLRPFSSFSSLFCKGMAYTLLNM